MQVVVCAGRVVIRHAGTIVADHPLCQGRRYGSLIARTSRASSPPTAARTNHVRLQHRLQRYSAPLADLEVIVEGGW